MDDTPNGTLMNTLLALSLICILLTGMVDPGETQQAQCVVIDRQWSVVYEGVDYRIWEVRALCLEEL